MDDSSPCPHFINLFFYQYAPCDLRKGSIPETSTKYSIYQVLSTRYSLILFFPCFVQPLAIWGRFPSPLVPSHSRGLWSASSSTWCHLWASKGSHLARGWVTFGSPDRYWPPLPLWSSSHYHRSSQGLRHHPVSCPGVTFTISDLCEFYTLHFPMSLKCQIGVCLLFRDFCPRGYGFCSPTKSVQELL